MAGIDLMSIGRFRSESDSDTVVADLDEGAHTYRKLLLHDGKVEGAILIGHSTLASDISAAIRSRRDLSDGIDRLRENDWSVLESGNL